MGTTIHQPPPLMLRPSTTAMAMDGITSIRSTKRMSSGVDGAPVVAGDGADEHAERGGDERHQQGDLQRLACPGHGEREVVGPDVVGAERVRAEGQPVAVDPRDEVERGLDVRQRPGLALEVVVPE